MKILTSLLVMVVAFGINLAACHSGSGGSTPKAAQKGGGKMRTYYMGRFAMDVPVEMKQAVQAQSVRLAEVEDFLWPTGPREEMRKNIWGSRVSQIKELDLPRGVKLHMIEQQNMLLDQRWAQAMLFYGNYIAADEGTWDLLSDHGTSGLWVRYNGLLEARKEMQEWVLAIAKSYRPVSSENHALPAGNWFYLKHGALNLPYKRQEKTYCRFEDNRANLMLEVEMNETHEVAKLGMAERLAAAISTRYAPGVDVDTLRSRTRTAAGLNGEELIIRMSASGEDSEIQFCWEYRGEVESGERPEIEITMVTPNNDVDAKLKVWDSILESFRPLYR